MSLTEQRKALIEKYFEGCNEADHVKMASCFTPDAVHYFPAGLPDVPWRGADTIASKWIWCVETFGSQWTIENIVVSEDGKQAVIEWTHWKTGIGEALRGDEWYCFDEETGLITEIRAYYASPVDKAEPINKLVEFDYVGRGYNMKPKSK